MILKNAVRIFSIGLFDFHEFVNPEVTLAIVAIVIYHCQFLLVVVNRVEKIT